MMETYLLIACGVALACVLAFLAERTVHRMNVEYYKNSLKLTQMQVRDMERALREHLQKTGHQCERHVPRRTVCELMGLNTKH